MTERQPVLFAGAGPGDPELITIKGRRALARPDLIHTPGPLIPPDLLIHARPEAEVVDTASMDLEAIGVTSWSKRIGPGSGWRDCIPAIPASTAPFTNRLCD